LAYSSKLQGITTQKPSILYVATLTEGWWQLFPIKSVSASDILRLQESTKKYIFL
jgi:hypothetical protein